MKTKLGHMQINITLQNMSFYRDLFTLMGWSVLFEDHETLGIRSQEDIKLYFYTGIKEASNDYDGIGMNHLGISTGAQTDVDGVVSYLQERGIPPLFETPRHRPEFVSDPSQTYYQVMFESPDRVLFEVVYEGPKGGKREARSES